MQHAQNFRRSDNRAHRFAQIATAEITSNGKAEQGAGGEALSDSLLDAICLIGPVGRCRERLAQYRDAGLDLPILWPALGVEAAQSVIAVFRQ